MTILGLKAGIEPSGWSQEDEYTFRLNCKTLINELQAARLLDYALINQLRTAMLYLPLSNPAFARNSNFDVANANACSYLNGGTLKTLSATTNFDTGTARNITTAKWGAATLSVNSSGTGVVTWAGTSPSAYATEAAAIAALAAVAATDTCLGYFTVLAAGSTWVAGTDALASGSGGTPATTTNYYNSINPNAAQIAAALAALTDTDVLTFAKG